MFYIIRLLCLKEKKYIYLEIYIRNEFREYKICYKNLPIYFISK